ncbi:MAG: hypothetical protein IT430_03850 [Phycisphaerales bacterium]|nr:hypothetical protein [Phycisphaerales bacterium]
MTAFSNALRGWLAKGQSPSAQHAERAQPLPPAGSARCARSAQGESTVEEALPAGWNEWSEDSRYIFLERLAIAAELGMSIERGSPAWDIAKGEAVALTPAATPQAEADRLAGIVASILGVPVTADVHRPGQLFRGEPDWSDNPLTPMGAVQQGAAPCRMCRRRRWWRIAGSTGEATCGACHPPVAGLAVDWVIEDSPTSPTPTTTADTPTSKSPAHPPSNHGMLPLQSLGLDRPTAEEGP